MRKLFSFMAISADGYHANQANTVDWQTFGPEFADYSVEQLDQIDTLVFGRTTYQALAAYWTGDLGTGFDPRIASRMNSLAKLVVSNSLTSVSSTLVGSLLRAGVVDELRLMVNPVLLGEGQKLFPNAGTVPLELTRVRPFSSGLVLLYYRPVP